MLLKKYENSQAFKTGIPSSQRPQFAIGKTELAADYYDEMDFQKREDIHLALIDLEEQLVIDLEWVKFKEGKELKKVYLNFDKVSKAYQLSGIVPKEQKLTQMKEIFTSLKDHPFTWVRRFYDEIIEALDKTQTAGLSLDDGKGYEDVIKVMLFLPNLEGDTPKRILSQTLFQDTKYLERNVERRLLSIVKKYSEIDFETDSEYLESLGIIDHPKLSLIYGGIVFRIQKLEDKDIGQKGEGKDIGRNRENVDQKESFLESNTSLFVELNVGDVPGGLGISLDTIRNLEIKEVQAKQILTVENLTTYHQMVQYFMGKKETNSILLIYTGGYPNRALQILLRKLADFVNECNGHQVNHWGDIDVGGIQIFQYLKSNFFPSLKAYKMDKATYNRYLHRGMDFGSEYEKKLGQLLVNQNYQQWHDLLKLMLQEKKRIEQESIEVDWEKDTKIQQKGSNPFCKLKY